MISFDLRDAAKKAPVFIAFLSVFFVASQDIRKNMMPKPRLEYE